MVFIVEGAVLPEAEDDADPFKGQGTHSGIVRLSSSQEFLIISLGPDGVGDGISSKFVEGLTEELAATPPSTDGFALAAAIQHWGDSALFLHFAGETQRRTIGAKGGQQPGSQLGAGPRQALEEEVIWVFGKAATEACKESNWLTKRCRLKTKGRMRAGSSVIA